MDHRKAASLVERQWDESIVPELVEYIKIPNKSPHFDPKWSEHGYMEDAVMLIEKWCRSQPIEGLRVEVIRLDGRTPLIYMEVSGAGDDTVLLYGHLDKQPEMSGWREGLGPWKPVLQNEKLYGRGGADDGYAAFASLTAIRVLKEQKLPHARCVILIEACEESGSYDLPYYIDALADRIGKPSLVVCLDSGCGNYDQLWLTTSLRGMAAGHLTVELISEGVHSGDASGIVPSSFRVIRQLLSRLEDENTGRILPDAFNAEIPRQRVTQAEKAADVLEDGVYTKFPFHDGVRPAGKDLAELVLNRTWRPALSVIGAEGLPGLENAGNVSRPVTTLKLSMRLPPTVDGEQASESMKQILEATPPYNSKVNFETDQAASGWNAPELSEWLAKSVNDASLEYFGAEACYMGEGGTIPFMAMLGDKYPDAQFLITGVLGPHSNAHGPNEFLHIPTGKKLTCCVARVLHDHFRKNNG
ncbi:MAG: M20/M25/M40 family metallo-hydrolase [Gammaproteobacteria bacterium]|nr:MAG: M20/M25/M40 family metallo-hydrolase [Gammaproteobacteria bacterium]